MSGKGKNRRRTFDVSGVVILIAAAHFAWTVCGTVSFVRGKGEREKKIEMVGGKKVYV